MIGRARARAGAVARGALAATYWARYDRYHRADATAALAGLQRTGAVLTADQRRTCDAYAREHLGSGTYAPWLYAYTACAGEFREGWLPDNYYGRWVVPMLERGLADLAAVRSLGRRALATTAFPDVAYVIDGRLHDLDLRMMGIDELAEARAGDDLVFKADGSSQGRSLVVLPAGQVPDPASLPDGVLQRRVRQHPMLASVLPDSVATLRVTTVREPDGEVTVRTRTVKFGRRGHPGVATGWAYTHPILDEDGTIGPCGLASGWLQGTAHPDTGVAPGGMQVPGYREVLDLARELHGRIPQVGLIGWDMAVDEEARPVVLEWNVGHSGITNAEALVGPCFLGLGWDRLHLAAGR